MREFTLRAIILGVVFGALFGAASVYLALKAGMTVSASIPIAVLAISCGRRLFQTTILENNIIQTAGSASESIASGVIFTMPGFLFLSAGSDGPSFFHYWVIFILALCGGLLGTLMMVPLRPNLIVHEHDNLPYPEGTACAQVLIAGDQGGEFAKNAYWGVAAAFVYAFLQKGIRFIAQTPCVVTSLKNKFWPSAYVGGEITPEYLGIGYIVGPQLAGVMVAGGVLSWLALIPLLATLLPTEVVAQQLVNLGEMPDLMTAGGPCGWNPITHTFTDVPGAIYRAYVRQIGAGAVACGGFLTLLKTFPTIVSSFLSSFKSLQNKEAAAQKVRTERDLSMVTVLIGCAVLVAVLAFLPILPAHTLWGKLVLAVLIVVFGFFFVTVSSRIVGLIGSSSSPISGMTIATIMGTCLIFIALGWTGRFYEPLALVVGSIVCIAAATSGATSQDLKTGYLVGATPKYQQIALFIGAIVSSFAVGWTIHVLDAPTLAMQAKGIVHAIGTAQYPTPQGTLMATLIRGLLSFNLDWQFVLVGAFLALTFELCGVNSLSFAVGAYLPISTTLPIFAGGVVRGLADRYNSIQNKTFDDDLSSGSLFATGLVAGGALSGVFIALCSVNYTASAFLTGISLEKMLTAILGVAGYDLLGTLCFVGLGGLLFCWACFDGKMSERALSAIVKSNTGKTEAADGKMDGVDDSAGQAEEYPAKE
ncbi:MAG: OPT family oligopeptide transporter [Candidatus Bruticola sp.]